MLNKRVRIETFVARRALETELVVDLLSGADDLRQVEHQGAAHLS
jgi:hypothetical protein